MRALTYVEVDIDYCANTYGVAPCTASIPTTGDRKCFNSLKTCQDRPNFDDESATLRFAMPAAYLPTNDIPCIASIASVSITPAIVSLGEDLGVRATLSINFKDHPHSDTGPGGDKYLADRDYQPFDQGTFWGKFRARHPFVRGRAIRLIRGELGQDLADMDTRHYVVESFDGPTTQGGYTLVAKDVLKLADDDRAQAPRLSQGALNADIASGATSATLTPAGIGNDEYPASGHVNIGGNEICAFTRAADVLTLTRAQKNTVATAHKAGDRVQLCLLYTGIDPATVIEDLLVNYAGIDAAYIPTSEWANEVDNYLDRVYTAVIAEPTGVNTLVSELVQQAALAMGWDDSQQKVRLQVLRAVPTTADTFSEDRVLQGSLRVKEQPEKRVSEIWTYFAQRDPTKALTDLDNYASTLLTVQEESASDYGSSAIKRILSRWIPQGGRVVAERLNALQLGRYVDPPRRFQFELDRSATIVALGGYQLESFMIQDDTGAPAQAPVQVTRLGREADRYTVEAEEVLFTTLDEDDLTDRVIIIDSNTSNVNFRTIHDSIYPAPTAQDVIDGVTLRIIVEAGVIVGSSSTSVPASDVGTFPTGLPITLELIGRIQGKGGYGDHSAGPGAGGDGGPALYTRQAINLEITGELWGGGGGGGRNSNTLATQYRAGGGGGAGTDAGPGGPAANAGANGSDSAGGLGGTNVFTINAGNGGGPGLPGAPGVTGLSPYNDPTPGGAAGSAIDGASFVTVTVGPGDRRGPEVN